MAVLLSLNCDARTGKRQDAPAGHGPGAAGPSVSEESGDLFRRCFGWLAMIRKQAVVYRVGVDRVCTRFRGEPIVTQRRRVNSRRERPGPVCVLRTPGWRRRSGPFVSAQPAPTPTCADAFWPPTAIRTPLRRASSRAPPNVRLAATAVMTRPSTPATLRSQPGQREARM